MGRFERLLRRLRLTETGRDVFVGGAGEGGIGGEERLFGGLVAAQAVVAAQRTVEDFPLHSLHAYFLRPGRALADIEYRVLRSKEGRNFHVREVDAWQNGERIFQLQASFQRPVDGVAHQDPMPAVPEPDSLPNRDQLRGRPHWQDMPIDVRMVTPITAGAVLPPEQHLWLKANGALPVDPALHTALVVYASDRSLLDTAWRPHADQGDLTGASLDHAMWFHHEPRFDDWLLYTMQSPAAAGGRGLAIGALYDRQGRRLVTVAQEGVLRPHRASAADGQ
jgi:acyl-CoA thioesterase-2